MKILLNSYLNPQSKPEKNSIMIKPHSQPHSDRVKLSFKGEELNMIEIPYGGRVNFDNCVIKKSRLNNAEGLSLKNATISHLNASNSNISGANFSEASILNIDLNNATATNADFTEAYIKNLAMHHSFNNADLSGAKFNKATITTDAIQANLNGVDFTGANINFMNLIGADLTGAKGLNSATIVSILVNSKTKIPEGSNATAKWADSFGKNADGSLKVKFNG